jgi:hypothetical protein
MRWIVMLIAWLGAGAVAWAAPPDPTWRGDYCDESSDCGWDDPCQPTRCQKGAPAPRDCEKSLPAPGECLCNENMCTLRPTGDAAVTTAGTCKAAADCAIDVATGTCHAGGTSLIGPITRQGPVCTCDAKAGTCGFVWSGPVACKSYRDCSYVRLPRLRAVPSRLVPRSHKGKVRPCKDGEIDSVCGEDGVCRIVGWSC